MLKNEEVTRLRWSCRRGMLELDLILQSFLEGQYLQLSEVEQKLFTALLACEDQDLFAWFLGSREPQDPQFLPLIKKIQSYARSGASPQTL